MVDDNSKVVTPDVAPPELELPDVAGDAESSEPPPQATSSVARPATADHRSNCVLNFFTRIAAKAEHARPFPFGLKLD